MWGLHDIFTGQAVTFSVFIHINKIKHYNQILCRPVIRKDKNFILYVGVLLVSVVRMMQIGHFNQTVSSLQTCYRCKTRRRCTKKFTIQKFPKILVLRILSSTSLFERAPKWSITVFTSIACVCFDHESCEKSGKVTSVYEMCRYLQTSHLVWNPVFILLFLSSTFSISYLINLVI